MSLYFLKDQLVVTYLNHGVVWVSLPIDYAILTRPQALGILPQ